MSADNSDRNLLFGALAVQMDFVSAEQLVTAMHAWMLAKEKGLGDVLVERGVLTPADRDLLAGLVDRHVQLHAGDVRQSLAAVTVSPALCERLRSVADADVSHGLSALTTPSAKDSEFTIHSGRPPRLTSEPGAPPGGRYRVLRPHAEGGLGVVSVALDTELNREVALKEIKPEHAGNPASRGRFVLEAEVTGGLEHPAIVPVYGFGRHEDGRPFYAMRFIRGESLKGAITAFHQSKDGMSATERNLTLRELLRRFTDVCQAVEYAHSRGVLHRDIKPENVMLGKYGETLVVDWGLAKPTGGVQVDTTVSLGPLAPSGQSGSAETVAGTAMGTPAYMPPEQAEGRLDELSARSDVYSLGATLTAILIGRKPVEAGGVGAVLAKVKAGNVITRGPAPEGVPRALWAVCGKAMAKESQDRYGSARELAAEVERFLADEPVTVMRDRLGTRARRWARKHPGPSTGIAASVLLLLAFAAVGLVVVSGFNRELRQANARESRAKAEAVSQKERAEENFKAARQAVEEYLVKVTENGKLKAAGFRDLRAELLRSAEPFYQRLRDQKPGDAAVEYSRADAFYRLAFIQQELGELRQAERDYRETLAIYRRLSGDHPEEPGYAAASAYSHNNLGALLVGLGNREGAKREYESALAIFGRLAESHPDVPGYASNLATSHFNLGNLLAGLGDREGARREYEAALAIQERLAGDHPAESEYATDLGLSHNGLGALLIGLGDREEARREFDAALAIFGRLAEDHPDMAEYASHLAASHNNLGNLLVGLGQKEGAEREYESALAIQERLAGDHPEVPEYAFASASSHNNLAMLLAGLGDREGAERQFDVALATYERLAGAHPDVPRYAIELAGTYRNMGLLIRPEDPAASLEWFGKAEALLRPALKEQPGDVTARLYLLHSHTNRAETLDRLGRYAEAAADWGEAADLDDGPRKADFQQRAARSRAMAEQVEHFERILAGEAEPADADQRIAFAGYCYATKRYLEAAEQHRQAFAEKPDLAEKNRYNATCCAALDLADLEPEQQAEWRQQALDWLRADLEALSEKPDAEQTKETLAHWLQDKDLTVVREQSALEQLPEGERQQWQELWQQVRELTER